MKQLANKAKLLWRILSDYEYNYNCWGAESDQWKEDYGHDKY